MFLMLATNDRSGRAIGYHQYGFGAAVLGEMALQGHIRIEGKWIVPVASPDDPLLATVFHDMLARRRKKAAWWVNKLSGGKYTLLRRQFTQRLVDAGIVAPVKTWFSYRYPTIDPAPEQALRLRIMQAVDQDDSSDTRLTCLIALVVSAGSARELHPNRHARKVIVRTGKRWARSDTLARAVQELIAAITAAIMVSVTAAGAAS